MSDSTPPPEGPQHSVVDTPRTAMRRLNSRPPPVIDPALRGIPSGMVRPRSPGFEDQHDTERSSSPSPPAPPNPLRVQANLEAFAKSLAQNKRRKTDHTTELVDIAKMTPNERSVWIADMMLEIKGKLKKDEDDEALTFELPAAVKTNCTKYVHALLLTAQVPAYMLKMDDVMKALLDSGVYPKTWSARPHRIDKLRRYIQGLATGKRCQLKDRIDDSIKNLECLDALCQGLTGKSGVQVTPGFRARAAFLRFTFANNPEHQGADFWEFVDSELKALRASAKGDASTLQYYMNNYADRDATLYTVGKDKPYTVITQDNELPEFQRAMSTAAAGIVPLVPTSGMPVVP